MNPWDVNHVAMHGYRKVVADATGLHLSTINGWCKPPRILGGEGDHSATERTVQTIKALPSDRGELIVQFINAECGFLPAVRAAVVTRAISLTAVGEVVKEVADVMTVSAEVLADHVLSLDEARRLESELSDVPVATMRVLATVREFIANEEAKQIAERRGPRPVPRRYAQHRQSA